MAYTDTKTGTTYTSPEVARQYGVDVGSASSGVGIQQQTAAANQGMVNQGIAAGAPSAPNTSPTSNAALGRTAADTVQPTPIPPTQQPVNPTGNPQVANNLKQAFTSAKEAGIEAPQDSGEAAKIVQDFSQIAAQTPTFYKPDPNLPQVVNAKGEPLSYDQYIAQGGKADFSNTQQGAPPVAQGTPLQGIEQQLAADPGYQQLLKDYAEFNSIQEQTKSLTDTYNEIVKSSGLEAINTELINTKQIIEGTEEDIRNEVQAASGFATESQVMALAQARNKTLIKSYNKLVDQQTAITNQVNTMVNLAGQDRQFAMQSIQQKLQISEQINSYRDKFINNAQEGYQNYINAVGYSGLYNAYANDPKSLSLIEKTMGLPTGTIRSAAIVEESKLANERLDKQFEQEMDLARLGLDQDRFDFDRFKFEVEQSNPDIKTSWQDVNGDGIKELVNDATGEVVKESEIVEGFIPEDVKGKVQSSNEYKTVGSLLPTIQAIKKYQDLVKQHGSIATGEAKGELASAYGNAIATWKTAAGLGALSGADFELAENAIPSTGGFSGFFKRNAPIEGKLKGSLENAVTQAENLTNRLKQLHPQAAPLLDAQLDDIKVQAYPDKFKRGPDGKVYELTDNKSSFNNAGNAKASKTSFGQTFNNAQKYFGSPLWDKGLDYVVKKGTEIPSFAAGVVEKAGMEKGWGNTVMVNLGNGIKARFSHLEKILVKPGQQIDAKVLVGTVGNTGNVLKSDGTKPSAKELAAGRGSHLDLTLYKNGKPMTATEVDKYIRSLG